MISKLDVLSELDGNEPFLTNLTKLKTLKAINTHKN